MTYKLTPQQKLELNATIPNTQVTEALWFLLMRQTVTTRLLFNECGMLSPTKRISDLRALGCEINCIDREFTNKFGRKGKYGILRLSNKDFAFELYKKLI